MEAFEQDLRSQLEKHGLMQRMKSLFMEAALDIINKKVDPSQTNSKLLKPSPALLEAKENMSFGMTMALIVDFLRQYNLQHTLSCLKAECGPDVFPEAGEESAEEIQEEREMLCEELELSTEGSALERLFEKKTSASAGSASTSPAKKEFSIPQMPPILQPHPEEEGVSQPRSGEQRASFSPASSASASSSAASSPASSPEKSPEKKAAAVASPEKKAEAASESPKKKTTVLVKNYPEGAKEYPLEKIERDTAGLKSWQKPKETPYTAEFYDGGEYVRYNQIASQPFQVENMTNCRFIILDAVDSVTMDDCVDCELVVAACENSIFIRDCKNLTCIIACKQLRTRDCQDCRINLFTTTDPVVESSCGMEFYPFNLRCPMLVERFATLKFDAGNNRFCHVYDFTADDNSLPKKHFTVHWPDHENTQMVTYGKGVDAEAINSPPEIEQLLTGEIEVGASLEKTASRSYDIRSQSGTWTSGEFTNDGPTEAQGANKNAPVAATRASTATAGNTTTATTNKSPSPAKAPSSTTTTTSSSSPATSTSPSISRSVSSAASSVSSSSAPASTSAPNNKRSHQQQQQAQENNTPASNKTKTSSSSSSSPASTSSSSSSTSSAQKNKQSEEPSPAPKKAVAPAVVAADPMASEDQFMLKKDSDSSFDSYDDEGFEKEDDEEEEDDDHF